MRPSNASTERHTSLRSIRYLTKENTFALSCEDVMGLVAHELLAWRSIRKVSYGPPSIPWVPRVRPHPPALRGR